ncbi:MAG: hypothetical protein AAGA75_16530 [Cyanobacteria bacterium P01_E01_bin.6]
MARTWRQKQRGRVEIAQIEQTVHRLLAAVQVSEASGWGACSFPLTDDSQTIQRPRLLQRVPKRVPKLESLEQNVSMPTTYCPPASHVI